MRHSIKIVLLFGLSVIAQAQSSKSDWPIANRETKPWTRWWWHGSAVTKEGITAEMEAYKKAGLGGLEITPIYGVYGKENQFVNYLTPQWMDLLSYTLKEAERLDLGIDMATGTGWPFGGPWITYKDACKNFEFKTYKLSGGDSLKEKVLFTQEAFINAIGMQIHNEHDSLTKKTPGKESIVEPVEANKNLQALALEQVKFKKLLPLETLMAFDESGNKLELTDKVDAAGILHWKPSQGRWKLYAIFSGWHGKMVERAGPGGEGNVVDHFSAPGVKNYLNHFNEAFQNYELTSLRSFFNDSYEVDDAKGTADWTPQLFEEFKQRRGYDLKEHLPALVGEDIEEKNQRVLCDYRETISDLVLENFTRQWKTWAHQHGALVRNQAHGSPSNILDLYATVDIPEIEGIEPLRIKMASSAGNVTGKKLISSESATWLDEHFKSNLSDIKAAVDRFMLHGVNHVFYHGTSYSPPDEPWPGWLFYAAVHLNPRNSLWPHFPALNKYIERCQSLLQNSHADNDVLLYYPIYDRFSTPGKEMIEHFDGVGTQFDNTKFKQAAETMLSKGYTFDYVSDKQIENITVNNKGLETEGKASYTTLLLPHCKFIPLSTFKKIIELAEGDASILIYGGLPSAVSGYAALESNEKAFRELLSKINGRGGQRDMNEVKLGKGSIIVGDDLEKLLTYVKVRREKIADQGIQFIRKRVSTTDHIYFISNGKSAFEGWLPLEATGKAATLFDPMTGEIRGTHIRKQAEGVAFFVQLKPGETVFVKVHDARLEVPQPIYKIQTGKPVTLTGMWTVSFVNGGPMLPSPVNVSSPRSWTSLGDSTYQSFSGCARYSLNFRKPKEKASSWMLDMGTIKESAEIWINGKSLGVLIGPTFKIMIHDSLLKKTQNILDIEVCNLMSNRIAYLDRNHIFWKKFYNVNFPARKVENRREGIFDASEWKVSESGLLGNVTLAPMERLDKKE